MIGRPRRLLAGAMVAGLLASCSLSRTPPADLVVRHGRVYTVDSARPWAEAVAIRRDRIVAVGDDSSIARFVGPTTRVVDAGGRLVLPGFTDAHIHFLKGALGLTQADLSGAKNVAELRGRLRDYGAAHPGTGWIQGRGWDYGMFGTAGLPDKRDLDAVFPDRPALLISYDGHTSWANSRALAAAGITRDTPDPPGGIIVRRARTGEPTGALKEAATALVDAKVPPPTAEEKLAAIRAGMRWANAHGVTRVHSAGGDFPDLALFNRLRREGALSVRFYVARLLQPPRLRGRDINAILAARQLYTDDWIETGAVKFILDGVIESHTAMMLAPYSNEPGNRGRLFWTPAAYADAVRRLDAAGLQIFTHAIGDSAVRLVLNTYAALPAANGARDRRDRIEHIETAAAMDLPRFGALGVIASMQPRHVYPDRNTLTQWAPAIGPDRVSRSWAWVTIAKDGGRLAFGSDWPVVTLDPFAGIQTGVTRQTDPGTPAGGFVPDERLTVAQAVAGYTMGAAIAGFREHDEGSLTPGKLADLIIVSQDIFAVDPHRIGQTTVVATIVGGKVVYEAGATGVADNH
jgi:predicted amidohydrolase YtcJ